ncbi:acidic leucine-rich nuclear phosphoprotein 32-related protein 2-like [Hordeum vulgare]|nr:acidic leucine-rich nuclear phosphoprotein 32-related protein 2-like [Hordeum vulgare]
MPKAGRTSPGARPINYLPKGPITTHPKRLDDEHYHTGHPPSPYSSAPSASEAPRLQGLARVLPATTPAAAAMAGAGEDDAAWERAISAAVKSAPLSPFSAPKTLTLDGAVKSSTGRLPSPSLFDRFPSLEELSVAGARLSSLAGLPRLPALRRLSLPDNRLSGAGSLAAVAESCGGTIRHLDLGNNRFAAVEELAPLAPLGVESLDLFQCPVAKLKGYREKAEDEKDEGEDDEPDSGVAEKSEVTNGDKSAGSALPSKRKRGEEDAAAGDN